MVSTNRRALHFVFKIGNRRANYDFFVKLLGMKVLRHEEFEEGCQAACNGPYDGRWSKTMIGYGSEDDHFVVELTYNYGVRDYKHGNDFKGITIQSSEVFKNFQRANYIQRRIDDETLEVPSPDGYKFYIINKETSGDPVVQVTLASSNIEKTTSYWSGKLGMEILSRDESSVVLSFSHGDSKQCRLRFVSLNGETLDHAVAYGRVAFSCPREQLPGIQEAMQSAGETILKPLVALDTPGKATVEVVILADPDGHEICFVGDEAFRELSQVDPKAEALITEAMDADKSDDWIAKQKKRMERMGQGQH